MGRPVKPRGEAANIFFVVPRHATPCQHVARGRVESQMSCTVTRRFLCQSVTSCFYLMTTDPTTKLNGIITVCWLWTTWKWNGTKWCGHMSCHRVYCPPQRNTEPARGFIYILWAHNNGQVMHRSCVFASPILPWARKRSYSNIFLEKKAPF